MTEKILIVEDESAIREMIAFNLQRDGKTPLQCESAVEAERVIADEQPDLVLLDWMLPGISGIEFARRLRRDDTTRKLPIIMLTARGAEDDKVHGVNSGVDDYIVKPFSSREMLARVNAVLRRGRDGGAEDKVSVGDLTIDYAAHRLHIGDSIVNIGPTEFKLLSFLVRHPERVYSRSQLLDHVWGRNAYLEERTVDVHIRRLRQTLEGSGHHRYVQTVRGAGYRFSTHV